MDFHIHLTSITFSGHRSCLLRSMFFIWKTKNKRCWLQSCYSTSQITTTYTAAAISSTLPHHFWHNFSPFSFSNWLDFSSSNRGDSNYWAQQQTCLNHWLNKTADENSLYVKRVKGERQELCERDSIRYKTFKCERLKHIFFPTTDDLHMIPSQSHSSTGWSQLPTILMYLLAHGPVFYPYHKCRLTYCCGVIESQYLFFPFDTTCEHAKILDILISVLIFWRKKKSNQRNCCKPCIFCMILIIHFSVEWNFRNE